MKIKCCFSFLLVLAISFFQVGRAQAQTVLPQIIIDNLTGMINSDVPMEATLTIVNGDESGGNPRQETYTCLVNHRGATSLYYDKKSLEIAFIDAESGQDKDVNLFGLCEGINKWNLDAVASDRSHIRNRMAMDLFNSYARLPYKTNYGSRYGIVGKFVEVWIGGQYEGLFCLTDKVNRKLLRCKKSQKGQVYGALYKCGNYANGAYLDPYESKPEEGMDEWNNWDKKYPKESTVEAWLPLQSLFDIPWDIVSDEAYVSTVCQHFYWDNLVDIYLLSLVIGQGDFGYKNSYLACQDFTVDQRFVVVPWDMDHSFGSTWAGVYLDEPATLRGQTNLWRVRPFLRLLENDQHGFLTSLAKRWEQLRDGPLSVKSVESIMNGYATLLDETGGWQRDRTKWNFNPVTLYETAQQEVDYMMEWYRKNHQQLTQLLKPYLPSAVMETTRTLPLDQGNWYDLLGRSVRPADLRKDIYIHNRKKILNR